MTTSSAPTPQELGRLFAEVFDLCDQVAASITDDEVEEKLGELLRWAQLEEAVAEPLPPCEMRVAKGWDAALGEPPEPCGEPAVAVVTITCLGGCRSPWRRSACASHVDGLRDGSRKRCGYCGAQVSVGGAS